MKTLEFIYQETQIHFLVNPNEQNVMVNATEMSKLFGRRTKDFLKSQSTKDYITALEQALNRARSNDSTIYPLNRGQIIDNRGHLGIYFHRQLALKFAAWLSSEFEVWVYSTIENLIFGNYKKHWDAHALQEKTKLEMQELKNLMLKNPTQQLVIDYFEKEKTLKQTTNTKTNAIKNQLKLFDTLPF